MTAFGRVALINLRRRPDRLAAFNSRRRDFGWRLPPPVVVRGVDGDRTGVGPGYTAGGGAWGCMRAHVGVLEQAVTDGVDAVAVFEDDAAWAADVWDRLAAFLDAVPGDWDQLMLGGQHMTPPAPVRAGVVRCLNTHRTHAYAVRGAAVRDLLGLWYRCDTHIDHVMGPWQAGRRVYAPDRFLFGQAAGLSDINGRTNPAKLWSPPPPDVPIYHLSVPPAVVRVLRARGLVHTGHERDPATDLDVGLSRAAAAARSARVPAVRQWAAAVLGEAAAVPGLVAACWHPGVSVDDLRAAVPGRPVVAVAGADPDAVAADIRAALPAAG